MEIAEYSLVLNHMHVVHRPAHTWFLEIDFAHSMCMYVYPKATNN